MTDFFGAYNPHEPYKWASVGKKTKKKQANIHAKMTNVHLKVFGEGQFKLNVFQP